MTGLAPYTWNADRELLTGGQQRHELGVGWRNYLNPGAGEPWRPIDHLIALSVTRRHWLQHDWQR
jgi:hypothetical protein